MFYDETKIKEIDEKINQINNKLQRLTLEKQTIKSKRPKNCSPFAILFLGNFCFINLLYDKYLK